MIRVLLHLPPQRRHARQKMNDAFLFNEEHELHLFEGRELTIEEFNAVGPKYLGADHYSVRPLVKIIEVPDEEQLVDDDAFVPPTEDEMRVFINELDRLRARKEQAEADNLKLKLALTEIEQSQKTLPPVAEEKPAVDPELVTEKPAKEPDSSDLDLGSQSEPTEEGEPADKPAEVPPGPAKKTAAKKAAAKKTAD